MLPGSAVSTHCVHTSKSLSHSLSLSPIVPPRTASDHLQHAGQWFREEDAIHWVLNASLHWPHTQTYTNNTQMQIPRSRTSFLSFFFFFFFFKPILRSVILTLWYFFLFLGSRNKPQWWRFSHTNMFLPPLTVLLSNNSRFACNEDLNVSERRDLQAIFLQINALFKPTL